MIYQLSREGVQSHNLRKCPLRSRGSREEIDNNDDVEVVGEEKVGKIKFFGNSKGPDLVFLLPL